MKLIKLIVLCSVLFSACKGEEQSKNKEEHIGGVEAGTEAGTPMMNDLGASDMMIITPCDCLDSDNAVICECMDFHMAEAGDMAGSEMAGENG